MGNKNSTNINNNENSNNKLIELGYDQFNLSIIPQNKQEIIKLSTSTLGQLLGILQKQNDKEKLVLKNLFLKLSDHRVLLVDLFVGYTCRSNTIEKNILKFKCRIDSIQNMVEIIKINNGNPQAQINVNSKIDNILNALLTNINTLESVFESNSIGTKELNEKKDNFIKQSKIFINEINKAQNDQFIIKHAPLFASLGFLGIGGTTALTATECIGATAIIATGATSFLVVAPIALPVIAAFGAIVFACISFYQESVERNKKMEMLKNILNYYIENIEFISQTMDLIIKSVCQELKTKVEDFIDLPLEHRIDFDLKSIKDEFTTIIENQKKLVDKIKEMKEYETDLDYECLDIRNNKNNNNKQIKN